MTTAQMSYWRGRDYIIAAPEEPNVTEKHYSRRASRLHVSATFTRTSLGNERNYTETDNYDGSRDTRTNAIRWFRQNHYPKCVESIDVQTYRQLRDRYLTSCDGENVGESGSGDENEMDSTPK